MSDALELRMASNQWRIKRLIKWGRRAAGALFAPPTAEPKGLRKESTSRSADSDLSWGLEELDF